MSYRPSHTLTTQRCAAEGCQRELRLGFLMCIDHWRMVPAPKRRALKKAITDMRAVYATDTVLAYRQAVADAVAAVAAKQQARQDRADAQTPPMF